MVHLVSTIHLIRYTQGINKVSVKKIYNITNENFLSIPMQTIKKGSTQFVILLYTRELFPSLIFPVLILQIM